RSRQQLARLQAIRPQIRIKSTPRLSRVHRGFLPRDTLVFSLQHDRKKSNSRTLALKQVGNSAGFASILTLEFYQLAGGKPLPTGGNEEGRDVLPSSTTHWAMIV